MYFQDKTLPIIEIQKQEGKVIEIDADQSIEKVANDLAKALDERVKYL